MKLTFDFKGLEEEISNLRGDIMALSQAVQDAIAKIKTDLAAGVAGIRSDIEELKKLVSSGASEADILAGLEDLSQSVKAVTDLDAENPTPNP